MKLRCVIGSLRLNDGTEYSKGDIFSLDNEISVQNFLQFGYVQEVEEKQEVEKKQIVIKPKNRSHRK